MPAVPRLLNRVYDKINNEISNSPIKKMLFRMALNSKEGELRRGIMRRNSLWDKIVFKKVQEAFGGQLRLMVLSLMKIFDFFKLIWNYFEGNWKRAVSRARVDFYSMRSWMLGCRRLWTNRVRCCSYFDRELISWSCSRS